MCEIEQNCKKLKEVNLKFIHYGDEDVDEDELNEIWSETSDSLQSFKLKIDNRGPVDHDNDPDCYNSIIFHEWRRQLNLDIIDLTNQVD
jgi:hypothetical protein